MIRGNDKKCPICGGTLRPYGFKSRYVRGKYGKRRIIKIKRYKCVSCNSAHNKLPNFIIPYVRYEADIVYGVLEGFITVNTLGFEDYPSEQTMKRWSQNLHPLLCHDN